MNETQNNSVSIPFNLGLKLDKYCQTVFGKSFNESLCNRMAIEAKKFIKGIKEHIESAEEIYKKDYLKIKES